MRTRMALAALAIVLLAGSTVAGDITPMECMEKMQNCAACAPMADYPDIGPNIRYDVFDTEAGFVSSFMVSDEKLVETLMKCEKACDVTREASLKLTDAEADEKLCPFCVGMRKIKARDDVRFEEFDGQMGKMMLATASTEEGVAALHEYAEMARKTSALLDEAAAEIWRKKIMETGKAHGDR